MEILRLDHLDVIVPHSKILEQMGFHGPLGPAAAANARAPGGRLIADAISRQLEVARLILAGVDEVLRGAIPAGVLVGAVTEAQVA